MSEGASLAEGTLASKGVLLLLVASHSRLVVDASFSLVAQSFVGVVDLCKFFFRLGAWIHVGVVLLGKLEVALFDVGLTCVSVDAEQAVKVLISVSTTRVAASPCKVSLFRLEKRH